MHLEKAIKSKLKGIKKDLGKEAKEGRAKDKALKKMRAKC